MKRKQQNPYLNLDVLVLARERVLHAPILGTGTVLKCTVLYLMLYLMNCFNNPMSRRYLRQVEISNGVSKTSRTTLCPWHEPREQVGIVSP